MRKLTKPKVGMIVFDRHGRRWRITDCFYWAPIYYVCVADINEDIAWWRPSTHFITYVDDINFYDHNWLHEGF